THVTSRALYPCSFLVSWEPRCPRLLPTRRSSDLRGAANPLASTMIASRRRLGSVIATSASSSEESSLRQQMHPPENALVAMTDRSEEHTSELQSRFELVCRLLPRKINT